jgi:hypothetical protein
MYATRRAETSIEKQGVNRYMAIFILATTFAITGIASPISIVQMSCVRTKICYGRRFRLFLYVVSSGLGDKKQSGSENFGERTSWQPSRFLFNGQTVSFTDIMANRQLLHLY